MLLERIVSVDSAKIIEILIIWVCMFTLFEAFHDGLLECTMCVVCAFVQCMALAGEGLVLQGWACTVQCCAVVLVIGSK